MFEFSQPPTLTHRIMGYLKSGKDTSMLPSVIDVTQRMLHKHWIFVIGHYRCVTGATFGEFINFNHNKVTCSC